MAFEFEKTMFSVYREATYGRRYRVCYFTELQDHNKEFEINRAMAGDPYTDGFLRDSKKEEAKEIITGLLARLNDGEELASDAFLAALDGHLA